MPLAKGEATRLADWGFVPPVYPPDLHTPIQLLRDAIEAQSNRALKLYAEATRPELRRVA